jgi:hypothetical protein
LEKGRNTEGKLAIDSWQKENSREALSIALLLIARWTSGITISVFSFPDF